MLLILVQDYIPQDVASSPGWTLDRWTHLGMASTNLSLHSGLFFEAVWTLDGTEISANSLQPSRLVVMVLSLSETGSITHSDCCNPQRTCSTIWEPCQKECPSTGVAVCEWLCPRPCCRLRQSNPQWQQVGTTKTHSSLTIERLSACQRVKRRGLQTKKTPQDSGEKVSWFSLPDKHAAYLSPKTEAHTPTQCGLGHLYKLFWFSLKSSTYAHVDANCYLRLEERGRKGMWNESNALTICRVVLATAAAIAPTTRRAKWSFQWDV